MTYQCGCLKSLNRADKIYSEATLANFSPLLLAVRVRFLDGSLLFTFVKIDFYNGKFSRETSCLNSFLAVLSSEWLWCPIMVSLGGLVPPTGSTLSFLKEKLWMDFAFRKFRPNPSMCLTRMSRHSFSAAVHQIWSRVCSELAKLLPNLFAAEIFLVCLFYILISLLRRRNCYVIREK